MELIKRHRKLLMVISISLLLIIGGIYFYLNIYPIYNLASYPRSLDCGIDVFSIQYRKYCTTPYINHYTCQENTDYEHCTFTK